MGLISVRSVRILNINMTGIIKIISFMVTEHTPGEKIKCTPGTIRTVRSMETENVCTMAKYTAANGRMENNLEKGNLPINITTY